MDFLLAHPGPLYLDQIEWSAARLVAHPLLALNAWRVMPTTSWKINGKWPKHTQQLEKVLNMLQCFPILPCNLFQKSLGGFSISQIICALPLVYNFIWSKITMFFSLDLVKYLMVNSTFVLLIETGSWRENKGIPNPTDYQLWSMSYWSGPELRKNPDFGKHPIQHLPTWVFGIGMYWWNHVERCHNHGALLNTSYPPGISGCSSPKTIVESEHIYIYIGEMNQMCWFCIRL